MLMPMLAAARGIERRRFAGGAWMSDAGGAPMMSSVPAPIAVIVEAVDASWQTGVLNDLSACRGVSMINVATNGRTNAVMTGAAIAAAIIAIISRATGAVIGVPRFNGSVRASRSGIVRSTKRRARLLPPPPADDLVWGRHAALAALEAGRPIHRVWCTPEMRSAAKFLQLLRDAKASGVLVEEVTWARLGQITGGSVHQGIALQTAAADTIDLESLIDGCSDLGEPPLLLALDGVTDPHNLGAVVRSAEAMGAHGVVLPQRRSAGLTGSAAKVAAGALEHLPVARVVNLNRSLEKLKDAGYRVIGLAGEGDVTLPDVDLSGPLVLVTGSEDQGLSLLTRRHCDQLVRIPLRGVTPSLNASVATALCVYEVARRNWMKDIHGQAPSPPIQRARMAGLRDDVLSAKADDTALPEQRIELELERRDRAAERDFDQSIQLSP